MERWLERFTSFEKKNEEKLNRDLTMQQTNWNKIATQVNHNDKKIYKVECNF